MFHPVGSQPPSVYWRRRFVALATLVVLVLLIVLTVRAATSGANGAPQAGGSGPATSGAGAPASSSTPALRHTPPSGPVHRASSTTSRASGSSPHRRHATSGRQSAMSKSSHRQDSAAAASSSPPPPRCTAADLQVRAYVPQSTYHVGDEPDVELQVTDVGSTPCVQDLSDRQIVLQVYNGESRVWGSHDCHVLAGTDDRVLSVGQTVRVSITWSGYTSTPGCPAGSRQRVGAGTYTLYASLSGHQGAATQFSIV